MELMDTLILRSVGPKSLFVVILLFSQSLLGFEIIGHKGIHHEECFNINLKCLASCLTWKDHRYIENTIPSIRKAFEMGAERVEIDLQFSSDGEIMVYHDDHLQCRTGANSFVNQLTVKELKKLDVAGNIRFLNRQDNPLKGSGVGLMPTLPEVLQAFPEKGFLLNPKMVNPQFIKRLGDILFEFTAIKKTHHIEQFSMWGPYPIWHSLKERFPNFGERFSHFAIGRSCEEAYERYGWSGYFPPECKGFNLALTVWKANNWNLWGGPLGMLQKFHENGAKIYLLHMTNQEEFRKYYTMQFDGMISQKIEITQ